MFRRRGTSEAAASPEGVDPTEQGEAVPEAAAADPPSRADGPFDSSEVDGLQDRLDLGSLWIAGSEGMELRLELDQEKGEVVAVTAVLGESAAQLQAFAAPKSGGLWHEIGDEIAQSIVRQGGTVQQKPGPLGTELATRMPSAGPDGRTVFAPARFLGVDGPRWFLRAVFSGRAAIDDAAAAPLLDLVRSVVVVRGTAPMAPRELLPLQLPGTVEEPAGSEDEPATPDLNPFERGPEITEVR